MKKICVFGASITSGLNDYEHGGWCGRLKKELLKQDVEVINLGVSGNDTNDLLNRFDAECERHKPDVIIIAIGGNDTHYLMDENRARVSLSQSEENFRNLIHQAKNYTDQIILIGLTKVDEKEINERFAGPKKISYKNETLEAYDQMIERVSKDLDLLFISTIDLIDEADLDDGLHPGAEGHMKIYNRVMSYHGNVLPKE